MVYRNEVSTKKIEFTTLRNKSCFASLDHAIYEEIEGTGSKHENERLWTESNRKVTDMKITRDRYRAAHRCYLYDLLPAISMRLMYEPRTLRV